MGLFPKERNLAEAPSEVEIDVRASDFQVRTEGFVVRLDAFLQRHLSWRSRSSIQQLIRDGFVAVDVTQPQHPGARTTPAIERRPGRKLYHRSRVVIVIPEELRIEMPEEGARADLDVLFEDEEILVVDKPPFVVCHPSGRHLSDSIVQRAHARAVREGDKRAPSIKLCHRLDRETSGLLLLAKDPRSHAKVMRQFERRQVEKEYLALVWGTPDRESGVVDLPIAQSRVSDVRLKMTIASDGLESRTEWRVVETSGDVSLIACKPHTGRQHQIRVHLDAIGHPLVGDKLYGCDDSLFLRSISDELTDLDQRRLGLSRHALHNHRLAFTSPKTGGRREVTCPMAADMQDFFRSRSDATSAFV